MPDEKPFKIQTVKIPLFNIPAAYADLSGGTLDTSLYTPWTDIIQSIKQTGADSVMLILSTGVLANNTDSDFDPTLNYNPDLDIVRKLVTLIQESGMDAQISMFTHVAETISGASGEDGGDRPQPANRTEFQTNFSNKIIQWAEFAEDIGVTAFIPFEDVTQHLISDINLTQGWLNLIEQIRSKYSGTLSTTWWYSGSGNSISSIPSEIIDKLDYLGLGFFPELTDDSDASLEKLIASYYSDIEGNNVVQALKDLSERTNKQIWITDKAFHSFDGASHNESRIFDSSIPLTQDWEEQRLLYESFLQVITQESGSWLAGVAFQSFNNINDNANLLARFVNGPLSESPQGKPALQTMSDWFNGLRQGEGLEFTDEIQNSTIGGGYHIDRLNGGLGNDLIEGFAGDDVLIGGPSSNSPVNIYTVEVSLRGVQTLGQGPTIQILDNNNQLITTANITSVFDTTTPAQSVESTKVVFQLTALAPFKVVQTNWEFIDFSATGNRFLHVDSITVNGTVVDSSTNLTYVPPAPNSSQVGALDSVHGGRFDVSVTGVVATPTSVTLSDDDILVGGSGNDTIDGGIGFDIARYSGNRGDYEISSADGGFRVADLQGSDGIDSLRNIERLQFADLRVALDLEGNAGIAAKAMGTLLGPQSVNDPTAFGLVLGLLDAGLTYQELMTQGLAYLGATTSEAVVNLIWTNLVGSPPTAEEIAPIAAQLNDGTFNPGSLGILAADSSFNTTNINLIGISQTGIDYIA